MTSNLKTRSLRHVCNGKVALATLMIGLLGVACTISEEEQEQVGIASAAVTYVGNNGSPSSAYPLGLCEGDCDNDSECESGLTCHQRDANESVPGCSGGSSDSSLTDYCIAGNSISNEGNNGSPSSAFPLGLCEGDCDNDSECESGLTCYQRDANESVPGCSGGSSDSSRSDYCIEGGSGGGGVVTLVGAEENYECDGQDIRISVPNNTQSGDLLVVFLGRTDDDIPIKDALDGDGWNYIGMVTSCNNCGGGTRDEAHEEDDCTSWHVRDEFCRTFKLNGTGNSFDGHDLAQSVFYRVADSSEPDSYRFDLNRDSSGKPGWGMMVALRGADTNNPVSTGNGFTTSGFSDGTSRAKFPSVYGVDGGYLLLAMAFDDGPQTGADCGDYSAPSGTTEVACQEADQSGTCQEDELGKLFGKKLTSNGWTGSMTTTGSTDGNKDVKISLVVKPAN